MMKRLALLALLLVGAAPQAAPSKPNIIVILSDDMGYSDLGCYGGEIHTPNLDALAKGGLRFTQFYNTARCCPTRASLLTGLYAHQAGVGHMVEDLGHDAYRGDLSKNSQTIAESLKPAGYRTYMTGKWHVTRYIKPDAPKHNWPLQRGFDRYYGTIVGGGTYYDPAGLTRDNTPITAGTDPDYKPATYYYTDAITDHSIKFATEHHRDHRQQPFFMYVAYTAAHWPMHALPEDIAKYKGVYDRGYGPLRKERYERMQKMGLIDPAWKLNPTAGDWDKVPNKEWEIRCMEVYAAMVDRMDQGIGRLVDALKANGQFENTLILFLQDNGACAETVGRTPNVARAEKPTLPVIPADALLIGTRPAQTRDGWPMLTGRLALPGPRDTFMAYGEAWANVSNTPFREYKHWEHEGGISTPLIAHWPAGLKRAGEFERTPGHLIDVKATAVDLAGATAADLEGVSLRPVFDSKPLVRSTPLFWEHEGNKAVRDGRWKLVSKHKGGWELYDMDADRSETADLSGKDPERAKSMADAWEAWAKRVGVQPWPVKKEK